MVDTLDSLEQIKQVAPEVAEAVERMAATSQSASQRMDAGFQNVRTSVRRVSEAIQEGTQNISEFLNGMSTEKISLAIEGIQEDFSGFIDRVSNDGSTREFATRSAIALSTILLPAIQQNVRAFGELGNVGGTASEQITSSFTKFSQFFGKTGALVNEQLTKLFSPAEQARNTELALIQLAAASGQLNQAYGEGAISQERLEQVSAALTARLLSIGDTTLHSTDQVLKYVIGLGKVPGALDTWMKSESAMVNGLDTTSAAMKVADAFGLEHSKVIDYISNSYLKFGTESNTAVEQLSYFAQSAQDIGLPLDIMQSFLQKTSEGMNTMSDSTVSSIDLLTTFGNRLKETGTSALGTSDIIAGMLNSARDIDLGKAAYINQAAGGRGGLAGAFEIEQLKQEGNFGEIVQRAMQAIEKMGMGSPVTLGDVKDNPALAGQLMQQAEMLKQFGLAQNNSQAYRVLEAMKEGGGFDAITEALKTPQEALQEAIIRGNSIAEKGFGDLVRLGNQAEAIRQIQAQQLLKGGREDLGLTPDVGAVGRAVETVAIQRTDLDADQIGNLSQLTADNFESMRTNAGEAFQQLYDRGTELLRSAVDTGTSTTPVESDRNQMASMIFTQRGEMTPASQSIMRPVELTPREAEMSLQRQQGGTIGGTEPVQMEGNMHVTLDVKDGIRTIATETFDVRFEELRKKGAVQSFNGNGN